MISQSSTITIEYGSSPVTRLTPPPPTHQLKVVQQSIRLRETCGGLSGYGPWTPPPPPETRNTGMWPRGASASKHTGAPAGTKVGHIQRYAPNSVRRRQSPEPYRSSPSLTPPRAEGRDKTAKHCLRDKNNHGTELAMKVVRQARLELSGGSTPDQLRPPETARAFIQTPSMEVSSPMYSEGGPSGMCSKLGTPMTEDSP